jgi:hypothetical protein
MRTLYNWTAKRAGARITVYGTETYEANGAAVDRKVRLTGCTDVHVTDGHVFALTGDGASVRLALEGRP